MFLSHKLLWKTFPLPSQSLLLAASSVVYHASNRVDEMTTLAIFTYSSSDTNHKYLNKLMYFLCSLPSFPFCCFWGCVVWLVGVFFFPLLMTVKWDKYIPVLNSNPTHSFPVGFCAGSERFKSTLFFSFMLSECSLCFDTCRNLTSYFWTGDILTFTIVFVPNVWQAGIKNAAWHWQPSCLMLTALVACLRWVTRHLS